MYSYSNLSVSYSLGSLFDEGSKERTINFQLAGSIMFLPLSSY